ncbi:MAG: DoxX family protein [Cyclobacteriaceae bacterium]
MLKKLLAPVPTAPALDWALLILRLAIGILMITHGWGKFSKVLAGSAEFGDPIGLGPSTSLALAAFAEFICSILIILGLATRLVVIPPMIVMLVAFFIVHAEDPFGRKEKTLLFLFPYISLLIAGPGKFSLDHILFSGKERHLE